eukprot:CAMPEP_0114682796 /NCGR_PEP_ID=MMETSP0191-20121206/57051_1 /TAXON_ID=126664 /ORGANISM="Sorites sp." /LENGTH=773 /DNA_ID=CAMNT_0001963067 /DNA_START=29 /DNA_END=2347 /DNA_ORIENTATION=+
MNGTRVFWYECFEMNDNDCPDIISSMPSVGDTIFYQVAPSVIGGIIALAVVIYLIFGRVLSSPTRFDDDELFVDGPYQGLTMMEKIAKSIQEGAIAFLLEEYIYISIFVVIMFVVIGLMTNEWSSYCPAFLLGAVLSGSCGWIGMLIAVKANVRTANAARISLNNALQVAFSSGGVMGISVVSLGVLGIIFCYAVWSSRGVNSEELGYLPAFGFGASAIALFARVGGGIFTKAADVGADLVGKVESDIPEDDPKNPATIADNVGDNVGDVAGMGADLFESFCGSIIGCVILAENAVEFFYNKNPYGNSTSNEEEFIHHVQEVDIKTFIAIPFWITGFGIVSSCVGIFLVRTGANGKVKRNELQHKLLKAINTGILTAATLSVILSLVTCGVLLGWDSPIAYKVWGCVIIGLFAGILIGQVTEYTTSFVYKPTISIAKKSRIGSAGVIIQGLGIGMLSTLPPVIIIIVATLACYYLADSYGVGIAAVGMLSTLGITLSTDAFGPVADNAGGIAEMADLPEDVREATDGLDALGNTTAATGKGFCIGSAVLATLALLASFRIEADIDGIDISKADVLVAGILGACLPYVFSALSMMAVGRAASLMIEEVRRQFENYKLLSNNPLQEPDYATCVKISTRSSLVEMITPALTAIMSPLFVGFLLGREALGGLLIGSLLSGFMLAIFMANSGGAWDNAKKFIEADNLTKVYATNYENERNSMGKGSSYHKATVVGDTVGDPFKDTAGPSLDILIKLMTMMGLLFVREFETEPFHKNKW